MDFVNEVSSAETGSKVPRNGENFLFWILRFYEVDRTESEIKRTLNWEK